MKKSIFSLSQIWDDCFKLADAVGVPDDFPVECCPDFVRVLTAATALQPDAERALDLVCQPLADFDSKSLRQAS